MYTLCTKAPLLKRAVLCVWACAHCAVVSHRGFVELQSAACAVCPYGETNSLGCGEGDTGAVTPGTLLSLRDTISISTIAHSSISGLVSTARTYHIL